MDQFGKTCVCCGKVKSDKKLDPTGIIVHDLGVVLTVHIGCWSQLSGAQRSQLHSCELRRTG